MYSTYCSHADHIQEASDLLFHSADWLVSEYGGSDPAERPFTYLADKSATSFQDVVTSLHHVYWIFIHPMNSCLRENSVQLSSFLEY
jgi:hypothetical protein